jgi:hypothetical protein
MQQCFLYVVRLSLNTVTPVYREPECLSLHPLTRTRVLPSPFGSKGGDTHACGRRGGEPNSDEGTDTLVLYVHN